MKKIRLIIDGEVLVADHFSGVGNYTLEMMRAIDKELDHDKRFRASIFVYFRQIEKMRSYGFKNIKIIPSPLSLRISNALKHRNAQQTSCLVVEYICSRIFHHGHCCGLNQYLSFMIYLLKNTLSTQNLVTKNFYQNK